jgi:hypothetical protein
MVIPIVTTYPAVLYDWHEHVERMHAMELHIPFESVLQPILGRTYDIDEVDESKVEVVFNTDITGHVERELDAIHVPDDADETLSLIWVQCRRCKWTCPVESYTVGECASNVNPMDSLVVEMDMLNMEDNILKEDYEGWSDHSEPEADEPVQCDSTDDEHSDTSTDELP